MRQTNAGFVVGCWVLLAACTGSERSGERPWHEPLPSVTVALSPTADSAIVLDTVRSLPAPEIRFPALLQPDPNHVTPLLAPVSGLLIRIADEHHVRGGETLAAMVQGSGAAGLEVPVRGTNDGMWRPRHQPWQTVWQHDTIGVVEEHRYMLAVGTVSDIDARVIHEDDPAAVLFNGDKHHSQAGRVEWVRYPGPSPYSAHVAVDFRGPEEGFARGTPVTVIVTPTGPGDSLAAVPASAVVRLPPGHAVFVPVGTGRYEVRWVATGPSVGRMAIVREGVKPGTSIVAHGLAGLVEAARDSLAGGS